MLLLLIQRISIAKTGAEAPVLVSFKVESGNAVFGASRAGGVSSQT
jgi:hypothetical protein